MPKYGSFMASEDYVYDAQWSPNHPAMFAAADGTGAVQLWDINTNTEVFFLFFFFQVSFFLSFFFV